MNIKLIIDKIKRLANAHLSFIEIENSAIFKEIETELNISEAADFDAGYFSGYEQGYKDAQANIPYSPQGVNDVVVQKPLK